jgi:TetR/AcrR family transcriptional repressor of nem operon
VKPPLSRKEATHERILETAARALRRDGYAGVGVADVMKEVGLTHGGFYAHFASRDAMLAEAVARAGRESAERMDRRAAAAPARGVSPLRALVESYLSDAHLAAPETGCAVAALASEMPRQVPAVRMASRERVLGLMAAVQRALPAGADADSAATITATMVGAIQLARALDKAQGQALLASTRRALLVQHEAPH